MEKYLLHLNGVIETDDTSYWYNKFKDVYIVDSLDKLTDENFYYELTGDMLNFYLLNKDKNLSYQEIVNMTVPDNYALVKNEEIKNTREDLYKTQSDSLYMSYVKYTALGQDEKASEAYNQWIAKVKEIEEANPYIE